MVYWLWSLLLRLKRNVNDFKFKKKNNNFSHYKRGTVYQNWTDLRSLVTTINQNLMFVSPCALDDWMMMIFFVSIIGTFHAVRLIVAAHKFLTLLQQNKKNFLCKRYCTSHCRNARVFFQFSSENAYVVQVSNYFLILGIWKWHFLLTSHTKKSIYHVNVSTFRSIPEYLKPGQPSGSVLFWVIYLFIRRWGRRRRRRHIPK